MRRQAFVAALLLFLAGCGSSSKNTPAPTCLGSSTACGGSCVELASDNANCGACGTVCSAGEVCSAGICALSCQTGLLACEGKCVDPMTDRAHCGASGTCGAGEQGTACAPGEVCSAGTCALSCQTGLLACEGKCIDPMTDRTYCGASGSCGPGQQGTVCASGDVCSSGTCALSCQAGLLACGGKCIDPQSDLSYCGASGSCGQGQQGATCAAGEVCAGGACALSCQAGLLACGGKCIDPLTDRVHCGASGSCGAGQEGAICAAGEVCSGGTCGLSCQAGLVKCDSKCVDPMTDGTHCGASGTCGGGQAGAACVAGEVCSAGACAPTCQPGLVYCGSNCIDPTNNRTYCGASGTCVAGLAGTVCAAGEVCSAGACTLSCQAGLLDCHGKCVDPLTDRAYCGASGTCGGGQTGTVCATGEVCNGGLCTTSCPAGQQACGGRCVDPLADSLYCGAAADCTGGTVCGANRTCYQGACYSLCPRATDVFCAGTCIDPMTDANHCGASGTCSGASAGVTCGSGFLCTAGTCVCPAGEIVCDGACVNPASDPRYCGATGTCTGASAGSACAAPDGTCVAGACAAWPGADFAWTARDPATVTTVPHFVPASVTLGGEPALTPLAHIVFDGTGFVDSTGNTHWTPVAVGTPLSSSVGMWTPAQKYAGPFLSTDYWVGDAATKAFLDANTSGDFTICARFKPGAHPGSGPNKILMANGRPEAPLGAAGWSLMQMHQAYCFHYHDTSANGEWMAPSVWSATAIPEVPSLEWSWMCGGRDGTGLRVLRESFVGGYMAWGGQAEGPVGAFRPSADLPTIGAYSNGSGALTDGGVYEIIITSRPATVDHMRRLVASASGGVRGTFDLPVSLTGADGQPHNAPPSTLTFQTGGYILGNQPMEFGPVVRSNPAVTGVCYGLDAQAADWTALGTGLVPLAWTGASGQGSQLRWDDPATRHCVNVSTASAFLYACGAPPAGSMTPNSRHKFKNCFDPADRIMRVYFDDQTTPYVTSAPIPMTAFPRLDLPGSSLGLRNVTGSLKVYRVFACSTADPSRCP